MPKMRKPTAVGCLLLGLLLCAGSASALTHEVRMHGPNGDGGDCPDAVATDDQPASATSKPAAKPATSTRARSSVHQVIPIIHGSGDDGGSHAPRWHSFLPGMFR